MRIALVTLLVACGSKSSTPTTTTTTPTTPTEAAPIAALPPMPPCEPRMDMPEGLHDRYAFTDEATEKSGFKNKAGTVIIPATFHAVYPFTPGGVAAAIDGTTPFVFIDTSGKVLGKAFAFDNGPDYYQEGFARIHGPDGKIGFISETTGKIEIATQFDKATNFCDGKAQVSVGGDKYSIDTTGKRL